MDTEQENARAIFPHLATCFYCAKEKPDCLEIERPIVPSGSHTATVCGLCRSGLCKSKPRMGTCFFCGRDKTDCMDFAINQTGSATVEACHTCRWGRTDMSKGKVYGRQTAQPESCRVVVELCHPNAKLPKQASPGDACYDLFCPEDITLDYGETRVIKLGLKIQLEPGWEAQIRGRSSLQAAGLLFTVGTIDQGYRKEIGAIVTCFYDRNRIYEEVQPYREDDDEPTLVCVSRDGYHIAAGERIAQMAIRRAPAVQLVAGIVEPTERGGFGSTGR